MSESALPPAPDSAYERLNPDEYLPHWYENEGEPEKLFVETNDGDFREFKMSPGRYVRDFAYPIYRLKPNPNLSNAPATKGGADE
jgi:hypothetical protein